MHYADLTEYNYALYFKPQPFALKEVFNIGWLENGYPYSEGDIEPRLMEKLHSISEKCVAVMHKGFHICDFCTDGYVRSSKADSKLLSSVVLWIPSPQNIIYASPYLIHHYITDHRYKPPAEFLEAVDAFDVEADWDAQLVYRAIIAKYHPASEQMIRNAIYFHRLIHLRVDETRLMNQPDYLDHPERKAIYDKILAYQEKFHL